MMCPCGKGQIDKWALTHRPYCGFTEVFTLTDEQYRAFLAKLDREPQDNPKLRALLRGEG